MHAELGDRSQLWQASRIATGNDPITTGNDPNHEAVETTTASDSLGHARSGRKVILGIRAANSDHHRAQS